MAVNITINGKSVEAQDNSTISDILKSRNIREEIVTVEMNGGILDKSKYSTSKVRDGDRLELVYYMGGGNYSAKRKVKSVK